MILAKRYFRFLEWLNAVLSTILNSHTYADMFNFTLTIAIGR